MGWALIDGAVDEPSPSLAREVGEEPLGEDDEPVAEADEVEDMDKAPAEPGDKAGELDFAKHADRFGFADGGHRSFVVVDKGGALVFLQPFPQDLGDVAPLLYGNGSKARQRLPFFIHSAGGISQNENFWMVRNREICIYQNSPLLIEGGA